MRWVPSGLPSPLLDLARAVEKTFAPRMPMNPPRTVGIAAADLTDGHAAQHPYGQAINTDTNVAVQSVLVAGVWKWRKYDGSAL